MHERYALENPNRRIRALCSSRAMQALHNVAINPGLDVIYTIFEWERRADGTTISECPPPGNACRCCCCSLQRGQTNWPNISDMAAHTEISFVLISHSMRSSKLIFTNIEQALSLPCTTFTPKHTPDHSKCHL